MRALIFSHITFNPLWRDSPQCRNWRVQNGRLHVRGVMEPLGDATRVSATAVLAGIGVLLLNSMGIVNVFDWVRPLVQLLSEHGIGVVWQAVLAVVGISLLVGVGRLRARKNARTLEAILPAEALQRGVVQVVELRVGEGATLPDGCTLRACLRAYDIARYSSDSDDHFDVTDEIDLGAHPLPGAGAPVRLAITVPLGAGPSHYPPAAAPTGSSLEFRGSLRLGAGVLEGVTHQWHLGLVVLQGERPIYQGAVQVPVV